MNADNGGSSTYEDIYDEYPELRDLHPRRQTGKKKKKVSNSFKLLILILAAAAVLSIAIAAGAMGGSSSVVFGRDGAVKTVEKKELKKYLDDGWFENAADIAPVTVYAEDGSSLSVAAGDVASLEEKGYSSDKSKVFTTMYSESGETVYVPNSLASSYTSKGWTDNLGDITKTLYKADGSKITVMNGDVDKRLKEGWTDRILKVAKLMISPDGKEEYVFNTKVEKYLSEGWTIAKRAIDPSQPMVALTFDDGPGKYTGTLLDCLEKYNSVATFYTLGSLDEVYSDIVKREDELGCEVGNHTWDHTDLKAAGSSKAAELVKKTSDMVKEITGKPTPTYRPPYGSYDAEVLSAVELPAIMWSIDTLDWKTKDSDATYNKIMSDVYDGAIILMHDIHQPTVEAAVRVIPALIDEGYQLVTVSELLKYKRGGAENGKVYFDAFE